MIFREFLYLDEEKVNSFLAQVEGGIYDESKSKEVSSRKKGGSAHLGVAGARAGAEAGNERGGETERIVRDTPESKFNRLYPELKAREVNKDANKSIWKDISTSEIVCLDCEVEVPSIVRVMNQADGISNIMSMMETFAPDQVTSQNQEMIKEIQGFSKYVGGDKIMALGYTEAESPVFAFNIRKDNLIGVKPEDLEGELKVVGKVEGKWIEGEDKSLLDIPGISLLSRRDRRAMSRSSSPQPLDSSKDMVIPGPGVSLSVIAIYR